MNAHKIPETPNPKQPIRSIRLLSLPEDPAVGTRLFIAMIFAVFGHDQITEDLRRYIVVNPAEVAS
jgi:hypothetical protein